MEPKDNLQENTGRIISFPPGRTRWDPALIERHHEAQAALLGLPRDQIPDTPFDLPRNVDNTGSTIKESGAADQPVPPGMRLDSKELYREDNKDAWGDWVPDNTDTGPEEAPETKTYALIVRREKHASQQTTLVLHSITVQSPLIRRVLGVVFDGYRGMTTKLKDLTFNTPFHEFFYRWDRFKQQMEEEHDDLVLEHMRLLLSVISKEIQPHIDKRQELLDNGLVTFNYLWALFEPDTVIYKQTDGQDRLYKLVDSSYLKLSDTEILSLSCRYIDCDGAAFGYVTTSLTLNDFDVIKPISELSVIPIHLHSQVRNILERLWKRGRSFVKLNGFHYKSYSGLCTVKQEGYYGTYSKQNVSRAAIRPRGTDSAQINSGRIIVDSRMWSTYNPQHSPDLEALDDPLAGVQSNEDDLFTLMSHELVGDDDNPYTSAYGPIEAMGYNILRRMSRRRRPNKIQIESMLVYIMSLLNADTALDPTSLTDDQAVFCTPIVRGYCLTSKQWGIIYNVR